MGIDILKKLSESTATGTGKYIEAPGFYRMQVEKLQYTPDGYKGARFVAEMKVVSAKATGAKALKLVNPADHALTEVEVPLHEVGDQRSLVIVLDEKQPNSFGNVVAFLEGLTGLQGGKGGDIDGAAILLLTGADQPMKGCHVDVDVFHVPQQKNSKKPFTKTKWAFVDEPEKAIKTQLKELLRQARAAQPQE